MAFSRVFIAAVLMAAVARCVMCVRGRQEEGSAAPKACCAQASALHLGAPRARLSPSGRESGRRNLATPRGITHHSPAPKHNPPQTTTSTTPTTPTTHPQHTHNTRNTRNTRNTLATPTTHSAQTVPPIPGVVSNPPSEGPSLRGGLKVTAPDGFELSVGPEPRYENTIFDGRTAAQKKADGDPVPTPRGYVIEYPTRLVENVPWTTREEARTKAEMDRVAAAARARGQIPAPTGAVVTDQTPRGAAPAAPAGAPVNPQLITDQTLRNPGAAAAAVANGPQVGAGVSAYGAGPLPAAPGVPGVTAGRR